MTIPPQEVPRLKRGQRFRAAALFDATFDKEPEIYIEYHDERESYHVYRWHKTRFHQNFWFKTRPAAVKKFMKLCKEDR